jgi:hypothetical protein
MAKRSLEVRTDSITTEEPVDDQTVVQPPWSAAHYPALDLMANWTNDRPSMSQILDGQERQAAVNVHRQSGDALDTWGSDNATK